uniref:sigma factor n=1 Tax=Roseimaritima sediminicola TaxID=2662066 RepID=UPI0012984761
KIARKLYPQRIERDDLVQIVLTNFVNKPPIWKPSSGAARTTFIYRCVYCDLVNAIDLTRRKDRKFRQAPVPEVTQDKAGNSHVEDGLQSGEKPSDYIAPKPTEAEILRHIEGEKNRRLCSAYIKHKGNATKTAKEVGVSDKTVLRKLARLAPKLLRAGYEPPPKLKEEHGFYIRARGPGRSRGS